MKNLFKISIITFISIFLFLILDIFLNHYFFKNNKKNIYKFDYKNFNKYYSLSELNKDEVFRHEYHGNTCTNRGNFKKINGVSWNENFGPKDKNYDYECILKLFSSNKKNILFFGGSAMDNIETPNYLTSIEYYLFKENLDKYRSINFSEGGSTLTHNLFHMIEIFHEFKNKSSTNSLKIRIDKIVFMQGYNDFLSIIYNGNPLESFYWTTVIDNKVHNAAIYYFDKFLRNTYFSRIIFNYLLKETKLAEHLSSIRIYEKKDILDKKIEVAANNFIFRKNLIYQLCKLYNIECYVFLQPNMWNSKNIYGERIDIIKKFFDKRFLINEYIFQKGYQIILKDENVISLVNIFDNKKDIFIDDVHFDKYGSELIAEKMKKYILIK